ncbi:EAL domain-containing protein [Azospirillum sp. RWY-5-1]|uniref:EAL domain-containing protein n=1 Tax=Azospirillum oleiclasticum TaxID=2735135 RepID=A0ABX2TCJ4_9PROT|nr:GGDEF domain-containing phosphodiesterase [Azospirillum oleiclasticum]NYZ12893.1 EAL domain-containing protein [Azospirillum oleiclasticum]NYZ20435.1 EAL domain-containing protein [Azospirillum oleiclasticum]
MRVRQKIRWLTWIGLTGCLLAAIPALYLLHFGLVHERERLVGELAQSARAVLQRMDEAVVKGEMQRQDAQAHARLAVDALNGGRFRIELFTDGAPPSGWPDDGRTLVTHLSFEPWGWTVAAAGSASDIDRALLEESLAFLLFFGVLLVVSWPLSSFLSEHVVGPIEGLSNGMRTLTEGRTDIDVPGRDRDDEFGAMARALEYFRRSTQAVLERDERLLGIMTNVGESIVLVSADGTVEERNPAAVRLFGADPAGRRFIDLFAEGDRDRVAGLLEQSGARCAPADAVKADALGILRDGTGIEVSLALSGLVVQGRRSFIAVLADVTERLRHERELLRLATRDRLTGLPNRAMMEQLITAAAARARRDGQWFAVLCLDLSRFKLVTDTLGHQAGDILLIEVARRVQTVVGAGNAVGRVGMDDFAVIVESADADAAAQVGKSIVAAFDEPVQLLGTEHFVHPSVGIALFPQHAGDAAELMRAADTALYAAKKQGGRRVAFFRQELGEQARHHLAIDRALRRALVGRQFLVHYQPKISLIDFSLEGFEALLRWERPDHGLVPPGEFIPVAEETGFIVPLGDWVLDEVCRQQREWIDRGLASVPVAVNISPRHLRQRSADDFLRILDRHGVPPELIELEITEGAVMQDLDHALQVLGDLKAMGVRVAVDDFGTGHSSLSYLKRLPVTTLKIDRSFVQGVPHTREDAGIVSTIIAMADMLGLAVVAEGVERPEQAAFLRHHNCTLVQGWLTGRPQPASAAMELLADRIRERA